MVYLMLKSNYYYFDVSKIKLYNEEIINYENDNLKKNNIIYSLLSLSYSFIWDVDINSESLRWIGGMRFEVYGA